VHLVGFIIRICHDARSPERQNILNASAYHQVHMNTKRRRWKINYTHKILKYNFSFVIILTPRIYCV